MLTCSILLLLLLLLLLLSRQAPPVQVYRSQYRGVSYDKKKRKWRVQIKVAALGKSGVSVGYFDTEDAAARAYDRAAIGLLGRANCRAILNFPIEEYDHDSVPELVGESGGRGKGGTTPEPYRSSWRGREFRVSKRQSSGIL